MGIAAVEIHAVGEIEAADGIAHHALGQADGIGGGHEHDLALDPALGLEGFQALAQVVRHDHAGDLVGMERGLDVDLRAGAFRAEALDGQRQARPGGEGRKGDLFCSHDQSMGFGQGKRRGGGEPPSGSLPPLRLEDETLRIRDDGRKPCRAGSGLTMA